jgi:hypothetical protein
MKEKWKDIKGYEELYQISNFGRVKALKKEWIGGRGAKRKHPDIILNPDKDHKGYLSVTLTKNKTPKHYKVHRLVLGAFVGESNLQANHIDGVKSNNYLDNIEYCSCSENIKHAFKIGLMIPMKGEKNPASKLNYEIVKNIRENIYNLTRKELAACYNVSISLINQIINKNIWAYD